MLVFRRCTSAPRSPLARCFASALDAALDSALDAAAVESARAHTPGLRHASPVLHFNNAGAALIPDAVDAAVRSHLDLELRVGGYEAADDAAAGVRRVYESVARLIHCDPAEVAVVENATVAWHKAFMSLPLHTRHTRKGEPVPRVLVSEAEYGASVVPLLQAARRGACAVEVIPSSVEHGASCPIALERLITEGRGGESKDGWGQCRGGGKAAGEEAERSGLVRA